MLGQAGSQVWPRGDQETATSRRSSPRPGSEQCLKALEAPVPRGSSMSLLKFTLMYVHLSDDKIYATDYGDFGISTQKSTEKKTKTILNSSYC